ncbi:glycosyl hydrolase family 18 protein [Flavihumibacter petaseus]|uniref:chitinase n=1 Tax=Flavihumibacter petaseus NBRC 106054 TaxID=1220578 RepID=A0A0E9MV25_9BACT|nr:glycosyl hydrolase family 18 protein [Flavihumibacter petaseus]GAO41353.1 putative hydrolase [Flavihumibacter petaseus NBRC 106054]
MMFQKHPLLHTLATLICCCCLLQACKKDLAENPTWEDGDYPRIFYMGDQFPTSVVIDEGDTAVYNNLKYSPAGQVNITWFVNEEVMSHDTLFNFVPTTGGVFNVLLEAELNGLRSVRRSQVIVKPSSYTPKTYDKVILGYLSENGTVASVQWNHISHLAVQFGQVKSDGSLDITRGNINQKADELVARGHTAGVPVLLNLFGRLTPVDGWALYESDDMGAAIRDAGKRAGLVTQIASYITATRMDGVDIMMTDFNGSPYYSANLAAIAPFISELKAAMPEGSIVTVTATPGWQHWEYPNLSAADWVNVRAYEDGLHVGPGAPTGQPSSLEYMKAAADIWKNFHLAPEKLVIGFPVFGLRYNELDASGNNASWGSYDYTPFSYILGLDPSAAEKEYINSSKGIYYNGLPLIEQKADYIKGSAFKGMYGWYIDADAADSTKSLFKKAWDQLN